ALDVYLNYGSGFHSNDARLAVTGVTGNVIPRAYEGEVGARARIRDRLDAAFALWSTGTGWPAAVNRAWSCGSMMGRLRPPRTRRAAFQPRGWRAVRPPV